MPVDTAQAERVLWLTVIRRAQEEAEGKHIHGKDIQTIKYRARRWLTRSKEFCRVCELAGFNHHQTTVLRDAMRQQYGGR